LAKRSERLQEREALMKQSKRESERELAKRDERLQRREALMG
jgi:hypothetical protein